MAFKYTEEQLNKLDKELLVQLFLGLQDQMEGLTKQTQALNDKMQLVMEQLVLSKKSRFGRSSEKMAGPGQIRFMEVDGEIVFFNEAEAVCDLDAPEPDSLEPQQPKKKKQAGKREADLAGLPVRRIDHKGTGCGIRGKGLETAPGCHFKMLPFCSGKSGAGGTPYRGLFQ